MCVVSFIKLCILTLYPRHKPFKFKTDFLREIPSKFT